MFGVSENNFLKQSPCKLIVEQKLIWFRRRQILANRRKVDSTIRSFDIILSSPNNVVTEVGRIFRHSLWAKMFGSFDVEALSTTKVEMAPTVEDHHSKEV